MIEGYDDAPPSRLRPEALSVPPVIGYVRAIRSHLRLWAAIVLAAFLGAAGWMATHASEYEASTQLLVTPLGAADSSFVGLPIIRTQEADPQRAVITAAALAESSAVLLLAAERLGGETSPEGIEAAVEIIPSENENIVEVVATAVDAGEAASIADAYAQGVLAARKAELEPLIADAIERTEAELAKLPDLEGLRASELQGRLADLRFVDDGVDPTLELAQPAGLPTAPTGPPRWLILVVALVAGVALASATAIVIEVLAPGSIDNEDDLLRAYPLTILARVPRGSRRLTRSPRGLELSAEAREAFRTLRGQLELHQDGHGRNERRRSSPGHLTGVVAITSPMTGDGKTTTALSLGGVSAAAGSDVIVLETDLRKPDVAERLGVEPDRDLTALLAGDARLQTVAAPAPGVEGMRFVAAPRIDNMAMIERLGALVPGLLSQGANRDLCVIVDTAALGEVSDALLILPAADQVVVAVRLHHTTHGALLSLHDSLERAGVSAAGFVVFDSPLAGSAATTQARRALRRR